ncbi:sulfite exporter TauE/SafE family protein [Actibacterium lipolyticum]|uniref:Probable membrane transporter protein n=1 Tax=Actibacterium lipolyticum TaxID=1524263 RepID=A0A238JJI8_9RHOB|nr:sulfite exporter TauE/SafE family protein [Actibacterium lipolyticum]SMX30840.1 Sulfite exporter TauE/SafE [Actibacterium lipolyticum]
METVIFGLPLALFVAAIIVSVFAGFVKGAVGFAMPMVMISGFSMFLPAQTALAALIFATVLTNVAQAFRQGPRAAIDSLVKYKRLIGVLVVFIFISAPLVTILPAWLLYLLLGVPILLFAVTQLMGRQLTLSAERRNRAEVLMGAVAGFFGGISGVWGPPIVAYLLSFNTEKAEMVRVQGVVFLIGGVVLLGSHLTSGVLNAQTIPLSAALIIPASVGMWLGFRVQDRLDPVKFRKATLAILAIAALNLVRKGLMG